MRAVWNYKRSRLRAQFTHPCKRVSVTSAFTRSTFSVKRGILHIVRFALETIVACVCQIRRLIPGMMSAFALKISLRYRNFTVCIYLWFVASTTRGEVGSTWLNVRTATNVCVFFTDIVSPAASKTATMTAIIFARPSNDLDAMRGSSATSMRKTDPAHALVVQPSTPFTPRSSSR